MTSLKGTGKNTVAILWYPSALLPVIFNPRLILQLGKKSMLISKFLIDNGLT